MHGLLKVLLLDNLTYRALWAELPHLNSLHEADVVLGRRFERHGPSVLLKFIKFYSRHHVCGHWQQGTTLARRQSYPIPYFRFNFKLKTTEWISPQGDKEKNIVENRNADFPFRIWTKSCRNILIPSIKKTFNCANFCRYYFISFYLVDVSEETLAWIQSTDSWVKACVPTSRKYCLATM